MVNERKQSPLFEVSNESILAPTEDFKIRLSEVNPYGKYTPFNFVQVINNSKARLRAIINDTTRKIVPAGSIITFDSSTIPAIWSMQFVNVDSANSIEAEEVNISFQKVANIQSRAVKLLGGDI